MKYVIYTAIYNYLVGISCYRDQKYLRYVCKKLHNNMGTTYEL